MFIDEFKNYIKEEYEDSKGNLIKPYYEIDSVNWSRLKEKYDKEDIKETLAEILMQYDPPYMEIEKKDAINDFHALLHEFSYAKQFEHKDIKIEVKHKFLDFSETKEIDEKSVAPDPDYDQSYLEKPTFKERHEKTKTKKIRRRLDSLFVNTPWFARSEYSDEFPLSDRILKRNNTGNK